MMAAQSDFYTPTGIHVYFKDSIENEQIDPEEVDSSFRRDFTYPSFV